MKTLEQFEAMLPDFKEAIKETQGDIGDAFYEAVVQFMCDHDFEDHIAYFLYEDADGTIIFFTDHPSNDAGFVFTELHDIISGTRVMTKIRAGSKSNTEKKLQIWWGEYNL